VIGRVLGGLFWFGFGQIVILIVGVAFFGLRIRPETAFAIPAILIAVVAMVGVAYLIAGVVLSIRDANLFVDCTNFLFSVASGAAFPILLLPGVLQPIAFALPTTYAMDILRQQALGTRPLFAPALEYLALIGGTVVLFPIGLWAYRRAERRIRRLGTINQY
jgi:ABC-2 type transport system permease protein